MRNAFRIALVIGAIVIVAALGLTAFASGSSPTLGPAPTSTMSPSDDGPFDISGNCDEPEHINDLACQGVTPGVGDDADDDRADDDVDGVDDDGDVDDNSGPSANSGPGNVEDDDDADGDNSGPRSADDDAGADNSGSGNGDHDTSGSGSGDDD